ncbi:MAG: peptidoglycan DD-metalloendopeptidase family protein [Patescibacteria group bacterium]
MTDPRNPQSQVSADVAELGGGPDAGFSPGSSGASTLSQNQVPASNPNTNSSFASNPTPAQISQNLRDLLNDAESNSTTTDSTTSTGSPAYSNYAFANNPPGYQATNLSGVIFDQNSNQGQANGGQNSLAGGQINGYNSQTGDQNNQNTQLNNQNNQSDNPDSPDNSQDQSQTKFPLRQLKVSLLNTKPIPQPIFDLITAFQSLTDQTQGYEISGVFFSTLVTPPERDELTYTRDDRDLKTSRYEIYTADVAKILAEIILAYIDIEQQASIIGWGELQTALEEIGLLNSTKNYVTIEEEDSFKKKIKTTLLRSVANSIWPILIKIGQEQAETDESAPATDQQTGETQTDNTTTASQGDVTPKDESSVPDVGGQAFDQAPDETTQTQQPTKQPDQPKRPEEKRPITEEEQLPLSPRLVAAQYRTQIAIVQNTVLFTMLNQLGTDLKSLPPDVQQKLQTISYQAVESLIFEKAITAEGREYLKNLATDPLSRYEFYFKAWTKISLFSNFNQVQQTIVQGVYEQRKSTQGQQAADQYLQDLEKVRQINIDQIRKGEIKPADDDRSAGSFEEIGKLSVSSNFEEDFRQKLAQVIGTSTYNPAFLINIEQNIAISHVNRLSPQYLGSLSDAQLMVIMGLPADLAKSNPELKQLIVDYYTLKIALFDKIFGSQTTIYASVSEEDEAENLDVVEFTKKRFVAYRQLFQSGANYSPEDLVAAYNSDLDQLSALDQQRQQIEANIAAEEAVYLEFLKSFRAENARSLRQGIIDAMLAANKETENLIIAAGGEQYVNLSEIPFARGADFTHDGPTIAGDNSLFESNSTADYQSIFRGKLIPRSLRPLNKVGFKTKQALSKAGKAAQKAADAVDALAMTALTAWNPAVGKFLARIPKPVRQFALVAIPSYFLAPLATVGGAIGGGLGAIVGGAIGSIIPGLGTAAGALGGYVLGSQVGMKIAPWTWKDLGLGGGKAISGAGGAISQTASGLGNAAGNLGSQALGGGALPAGAGAGGVGGVGGVGGASATTGGAAAFKSGLALVSHPAVYSTLGAIGTVTVAMISNDAAIKQAFMANFQGDENTGSVEETSDFFEIDKTLESSCEDNKCETPPGEVTYVITIKPKGDYKVAIRNISDDLKVSYNKELWKNPPKGTNIKKDTEDFRKAMDPADASKYLSKDLNSREALPPEGITIRYSANFDDQYNNAAIRNTVKVTMYIVAAGYTDDATAYEFLRIGEPPQGEGCWPTFGPINQLPYGDYSHRPAPGNTIKGYADAFDIGSDGQGAGRPLYAPFSGELCYATKGDRSYGNYAILKADNGESFLFAHMDKEPMPSGSCVSVEPGYLVGIMGDTGNSDGAHLHYELLHGGGFYAGDHTDDADASLFRSYIPFEGDSLYELAGQHITTCFEES